MAENKYWFARRFPVGHPRNAMAPVSPEGWRVVWTFVGWMTGGAFAAIALVLVGLYLDQPWAYVVAVFAYVACTMYGGWYFLNTAISRGDHNHTVADYKAGRVA